MPSPPTRAMDWGSSAAAKEVQEEEEEEEEEDAWTTVRKRPAKQREWDDESLDPRRSGAAPSASSSVRPGSKTSCGGRAGREDKALLDRKVYVQGLTASTKDSHLLSAFRHCGRVDQAYVIRQSDGRSRGFGFVIFADAGAAAMAARDGGVRIDGKLCHAVLSSRKEECRMAEDAGEGLCKSSARKEILDFTKRHELAESTRIALQRADPEAALKVVRCVESCVESCDTIFRDGLVHAQLQKVCRSALTKDLETKVVEFTQSLNLTEHWRERLEDVLLAQRSEDVVQVLQHGQLQWFSAGLRSKENPVAWLLSFIHRFQRKQVGEDILVFCERFGFGRQTAEQLHELSVERACRLMRNWHPTGPGPQRDRESEFLVQLAQALKERRAFLEERGRREVSMVASHARIMEEWSDNDEEDDEYAAGGAEAEERRDPASKVWAADASDEADGHGASGRSGAFAGGSGRRSQASSSAEQFIIHASHSGPDSSSVLSAKQKRRVPKPTHFVLCLDTSGSMATLDCQNGSGGTTTRLEAVLTTCKEFITGSVLHGEDVFSFCTFNEESQLHFICQKAFNAITAMEKLHVEAEKQTLYAMGIRVIDAAIRRDQRRLPAHVLFLSDGEPTDPQKYIKDLHQLRRKHPGDALKIYAVGFGESGKVNAKESDFPYLQQLASLGRGHFQRCGASLQSLQGAFTAVTSTISQTRSSTSRRSSTEKGATSNRASASAWGAAAEPAAAPASDRGTAQAASQAEGAGSDRLPKSIPEQWEQEDSGAETEWEDVPAAARSGGGDTSLSSRDMPAGIEFELPHPKEIFRNVDNQELWKNFMAAATYFKFNGREFTRKAKVHQVFLRRKPFMQGGMRLVYGMVLEEGKHAPDLDSNMMCAKRLFQDLAKDGGFQAHAAFCKSTAVAHYYAAKFRAETGRLGNRVQLGFLDCQLYSPVGGRQEDGYHFCGEQYLKGHFVKLNSNAGFVNETEYSEHSEIAQAFSHFTFDRSHGELIVVDLQGICGENRNKEPYFLLTDPQVHSLGAYERFGAGDLGEQGVTAFFRMHKCNNFCHRLSLRQEHEMRPPTHKLPMPGAKSLIGYMLHRNAKEFFQSLRQECRVSSITIPKEAHSDWVFIRMWASKRSGSKAEALLQQRLQAFYEKAREVVPVDPQPRWSVAQWQSHLEAWRKSSRADIVAAPPDWENTGQVKELWVFSESEQNPATERWYYSHTNSNYACKIIKECLSRPGPAEAAVEAVEAVDAVGGAIVQVGALEQAWKKYSWDGQNYWFRESDNMWFYESDPTWQKFLDGEKQRNWWYHNQTGTWFYEPLPTRPLR